MKLQKLLLLALVFSLAFVLSSSAWAVGKKTAAAKSSPTATPAPSQLKKTDRPIPYHGSASAVDQSAKTFSIQGLLKSRVFKVTDKTVITKASESATWKDITEGEQVRGSYWKQADGTMEAKTVKLGPLTAAEQAAKDAHAAKGKRKKTT